MCEKFKMFLDLIVKANVPQDPEIPLFSSSDQGTLLEISEADISV